MVIHPGSYELRVGMAWDLQPKVVKHVVAKRIMKFDKENRGGKRASIVTPQTSHPSAWPKDDPNRDKEAIAAHHILAGYKNKDKITEEGPSKKTRYNNESVASILKPPNCFEFKNADFANPKWSQTDLSPMYFFGEEAINLAHDEPYDIIWPLQRGEFNKSVDLATICELFNQHWTEAIQSHLGIPQRAFKDCIRLAGHDSL